MAIHGGLTQNKREFALKQLRDENIDVLAATDVGARGLDIKNVTSVYNCDLPKTSEEYIHRIEELLVLVQWRSCFFVK